MKETLLDILLKKASLHRQLLYASLELTYKCNFACKFCYNPVERKGQERTKSAPFIEGGLLSLSEILVLLKRLRETGCLYFTLTGGEPMVHQNFWEIAEAAKKEAFLLRVFTNGSLINEEAAERLGKIFPNLIEISLYGACEESYEKSCGRPDAFPKVIKALGLLKNKNIKVVLKCMLTNVAENEMNEIQDIADRFEYPLNWEPVLQKTDDGDDYPFKMRASRESIEKLLNNPRFRMGKSQFEGDERQGACNIGKSLIHIDPYGNVYPCIAWREPLGNVRTDNISELWKKSGRLKELMRLSRRMAKKIKDSGLDLRHCMGSSRHLYNDPLKFDEAEMMIAEMKKMK